MTQEGKPKTPVERKTQETQPTEQPHDIFGNGEQFGYPAGTDSVPCPCKGCYNGDECQLKPHVLPALPPEATELEAIFHNFKVHHKTLDACFNDAVAVRSIEDTLEAWKHQYAVTVLEDLKSQVEPISHTDDAVLIESIDAAIQAELTQAKEESPNV